MNKKIFCVSDEHGHFDVLKKALDGSGYDENNEEHLLISCGDIFDRGEQNLEIYLYYKRLCDEGKMVLLNSNHTKFFIDFLEGSNDPFNYINNGLNQTIADFWHRTMPFESWCSIDEQCEATYGAYAKWAEICRNDIKEDFPELLPWLKSLPNYFETENHIFVHASIDTKVDDWHNPHCYRYSLIDWDALHFDDGTFFGSSIVNTDKTVVIGHFSTSHLRNMYNLGDNNDNSILVREDGRVIALDAATTHTKMINVLKVEDFLL